MRIIKKAKKIVEKETVTSIQCDGCGAEADAYINSVSGPIDWPHRLTSGIKRDQETTVCWHTDAKGNFKEIIVCPTCFKKIVDIFGGKNEIDK